MKPSPERRKYQNRSGSPFRKKSKKLAAICEEEYNRNHGETKEKDGGSGLAGANSELRRSSRVRRAPLVLDASPPPPKKRKPTGKNEHRSTNKSTKTSLGSVKEESDNLDTPSVWKSRLRSRASNVGFLGRPRQQLAVNGKRKLFDESNVYELRRKAVAREMEGKSGAPNVGKLTKSKGPVQVKESESSEDSVKQSETSDTKDESESDSEESTEDESESREEDKKDEINARLAVTESETEAEAEAEAEADGLESESEDGTEGTENEIEDSDGERESETEGGSERMENEIEAVVDGMEAETKARVEAVEDETEMRVEGTETEEAGVMAFEGGNDIATGRPEANNNLLYKVQNEKGDTLNSELLQEVCFENNEGVEQSGQTELLDCHQEHENQQDAIPIRRRSANNMEEAIKFHDRLRESSEMLEEFPIESESANKVVDSIRTSAERLSKPRFKQGRRCGLCGVGTDGRPPKKLIEGNGDSDVEAHSGSSASEEPNYDIWDGFGDDPGWLGRLLGPINDRYGIAGTWVHQHCAVWSPEVYFAGLGHLKNVRAALCRGRSLKCTRCGRPGATIGCRVDRCPRTYHLPCARANGCIFDHRKFLIACTDHRHLFQPYGPRCQVRMKKMKAKRMRLEMRKLSNDAWRKDVEAEEKWFEKCGEDEEFLKRESKRLHRDLLRVAPVYIGGSDFESGKLFEGWDSVAGLESVIQCMKEVVILPLLYPEFFDNLGLTPPRGVLLHGHPGTGKTLVVRALIGSLARGDKRIAYFARKGADCLGKYVGDAERQLRLLFQVAEKCQPSIIFFDEIDGLAPRRSRQQDQTHSSVVSTLLALLDGLKSRGSVVVIGATNRPDAIDPALRRPGRFDREIYFPLPSLEDRAAIISLHTKKWPKPVSGSLLKWIAGETVGFAGADLQALCTQAAMIALKRNFPLQEVMALAQLKIPGAKRVTLPDFSVEERDWLEALSCSPPPCSRREAGVAAGDIFSSPLPIHLVPSLLRPLCVLLVAFHLEERIWLPPLLSKAAADVRCAVLSAMDNKRMTKDCWWSHVDTLLREADVVMDIVTKLSYAGILNGGCYVAGSDASTTGGGDCCSDFGQSIRQRVCARPRLLGNLCLESRSKPGFQVLIAGGPKFGQRHLASCILHCFIGNVEVQKIDMATISQEGNGDLVQGLTHLLIKCASMKSCMVFMPRIDLWALETQSPLTEEEVHEEVDYKDDSEMEVSSPFCVETLKQDQSFGQQCETEETMELQGDAQVSHAWNTFVEQVASLRVSMTVMLLATSGVPCKALPDKIQQFFKTDLSKDNQQTSSQAVPQFTVRVGENFDHDMTIKLSVTELLRQAIQLFVHLVHQRSHTHDSLCKEHRRHDSAQGSRVEVSQQTSHGSGKGGEKSKFPDDCSIRIPPLPISRYVKAKSSLQLAVLTFGYQILRYPHFAELCWVTSKLKEGPCADVSGPWRGWPFNSCIICPCNSSELAGAAFGSSNVKGKESSGLVRGLIAVGLSAYRGAYSSPREVSFEVRKVLELLVGWINVKVNSGKDRHRYVRILSQVAYLEDLVNSWAYALRSFESNAQTELTNPKSCAVDDLSTENKQPEQRGPDRSCPGSDGLEENPKESTQNIDHPHQINTDGNLGPGGVTCIKECSVSEIVRDHHLESNNHTDLQPVDEMVNGHTGKNLEPYGLQNAGTLAAQNTGCLNLNKENGDVVSSSVGTVIDSRRGSNRQTVLLDLNCPAVDHEQNGTHPGPCDLETTGTAAASEEKANSQHDPIGFDKSNFLNQNNPNNSAESNAFRFLEYGEACNQVNVLQSVIDKPEPEKQVEVLDVSSTASIGHADDPGFVCLYRCCSQCLSILQHLILKLITRESSLGRSHITTEDVHDAVASLSVELTAAVRKFIVARNRGMTQQENVEPENRGMLSGCSQFPERKACPCKRSGDNLIASVECCCHSVEGSLVEANSFMSPKSWFDPVFLFRDGILVPVDTDEDLSFHCKFENFCLCFLIETIATGMKPFC